MSISSKHTLLSASHNQDADNSLTVKAVYVLKRNGEKQPEIAQKYSASELSNFRANVGNGNYVRLFDRASKQEVFSFEAKAFGENKTAEHTVNVLNGYIEKAIKSLAPPANTNTPSANRNTRNSTSNSETPTP